MNAHHHVLIQFNKLFKGFCVLSLQ